MNLTAVSGATGEVGASQLRFFIIRSNKRRTLQLSVGVRGVGVRAPSWVPVKEIEAFVYDKRHWIERAVREAGILKLKPDVFLLGGPLYFLGDVFELEVAPQDGGTTWLEELPKGWRVKGDRDLVQRLIIKWYRIKAEKVFNGLMVHWAERMEMSVPGCVVKAQQRLWGSYSSRTKTVNLNWRMIAFPPEIIEYIVIHELAHARHLHHGKSFWVEVAKYCPNWRERRLWLRTDAKAYLF
ncbi:MAG: M48 family metallopeptidase [Candidatus Omnitrophica bacterium]|nr:M48 family metallopeptidase [Candidatus Omnitrophota bacterium]